MAFRNLLTSVAAAIILLASCVALLPGVTGAEESPATSGLAFRSNLVSAQQSLLDGDTNAARESVAEASQIAQSMTTETDLSSSHAVMLEDALAQAAVAVDSGNGMGLSVSRGTAWGALMAVAYSNTLTAISEGDLNAAAEWALLRDFPEATKLASIDGGATQAINQLANQTITLDEALVLTKADLLNTYQDRLGNALSALALASDQDSSIRVGENAGVVPGYWAILAPEFESQFTLEKRQQLDALAQDIVTATSSGDLSAVAKSARTFQDALVEFRAAPLSEDQQARKAGQTLLYLSLVSVEYGRGVKNGEIVVPIEIEEARSFFDGARQAFLDLRPTLQKLDPDQTNMIAAQFNTMQSHLDNAARNQNVASADQIHDLVTTSSDGLTALYPKDWVRAGGSADFDVISSLLDQMERAVAAKQYDQAESVRLEAYAIFDAGAEKRLLAFDPQLSQEIEVLFWQGTSSTTGLVTLIKDGAGSGPMRNTRLQLDEALNSAQLLLGQGSTARAAVIFNSATIVFREGLEAVLILVSLTASMIGANRQFKKPLALGAGMALLVSALLFFLAQTVLLSLGRHAEKVEAIVSVVAIGILLLVMNWFFHKVYWTRWIAGHQARKRVVLGGAAGQALGLVMLGFTSVFREGAETVLFLQALVLDSGTAVVVEGTLLGLAAVTVVGILVFAMQRKLPHKQMLKATGVMLTMVLVTMVGNTVHVLQVVGWAPISPIREITLPYWTGTWFGLFATWEGVILQMIAVIFVIGSYYAAEYLQERSRQSAELSASHGASMIAR